MSASDQTKTSWVPSNIEKPGDQPEGFAIPIPYVRSRLSEAAQEIASEDLERLAKSIATQGLKHKIVVCNDEVLQGWHRLCVLCRDGTLDMKKHVRVVRGKGQEVYDREFEEAASLEIDHRHMTVSQKVKYLKTVAELRGIHPKYLPQYKGALAKAFQTMERAERVGLIAYVGDGEGEFPVSKVPAICQSGLVPAILAKAIPVKRALSLAVKLRDDKEARDEFLSLTHGVPVEELEELAVKTLQDAEDRRKEALRKAEAEARRQEKRAREIEKLDEIRADLEEAVASEEDRTGTQTVVTIAEVSEGDEQVLNDLDVVRRQLADLHRMVDAQEAKIREIEAELAREQATLARMFKDSEALGRREEAIVEQIGKVA